MLTALVLRANQPLSVARLVDAVWGDESPSSAHGLIQTYVWRLRRLFRALGEDEDRLSGGPGGYLLRVDPGGLDSAEFDRLLGLGTHALAQDDASGAAHTLRAALALWRGDPIEDVVLHGGYDSMVQRMVEQRTTALEERIEADLRLGLHESLVGELRQLSAEYPLRERFSGQLMLALYRSGRQAEALATFQALRTRLADELGIDPCPDVCQLHESMLRADTALAGCAGEPRARQNVVPRQLSAGIPHFAGRVAELEALTSLLGRPADTPGTVVISAIHGTAGIGKTALAIHWAHQVAHEFPDGQLYVNLRGFDPSGDPVAPAEAIRGFLDAFQIPTGQIPVGLDAQAALYRTLLATKRTLVVLDNARDADQIRLLLPGSPTCMAVITSRNQLVGLIAAEGAQPVTLGLLTPHEARELLGRRLEPGRIANEPEATARLIDLCARLPLALNIAAARAATHPTLPLGKLVAQLQDARNRLDALDTRDQASDIRAMFSCSYEDLDADSATMFRLLGIHPGPDISLPAAASLAGLPMHRARGALDRLTSAHLLTEHTMDRFAFHDLLRVYAAERAQAVDSAATRDSATHRVLDHYLHTAHSATQLLNATWDPFIPVRPQHAVLTEELADPGQALAWFEAEHQVLLAAITHAAEARFDTHAWQIPHTLLTYFDRRGHWIDLSTTGHIALSAAQRVADRTGQACSHRGLARACMRLGSLEKAHQHLVRALELCLRPSDRAGQAHTHHDLALVCEQQGRNREALRHAQQVHSLLQAQGHPAGVANALNNIGWFHSLLGDHQQALTYCQQALILQRELGNHAGEAGTWDSLGHTHHHLGNHDEAISCFQHAIELYQQIGDRYYEAGSLIRLGDAQQATGAADTADETWLHALAILEDLQHPDAENVRTKLRHTVGL
ncbi:DNA-binding SARP family transcriptional activator/tetratricopeptide (TPR) repeat protein [Streptacidiphilus sp. MAP12-16]